MTAKTREKSEPRAAVVVYSHYPADPRVRRETEALAELGLVVDVICLRDEGEQRRETVNGVNVSRLGLSRKRAGIARYLWEYLSFVTLLFWQLSIRHIRKHYRLIHVHNMPDVLVLCSMVPRLSGARVVLDLHDPVPELYMTKYGHGYHHPAVRLLRFVEKSCIGFSHLALTPNIAFRDLFLSRSCAPDKMKIVMNSPQESIFHCDAAEAVRNPARSDRAGFVLMYHGLIVERHGLDTALNAVCQIREVVPDVIFHIYGSGDHFVQNVKDQIAALGLQDVVAYHGQVPYEEIARTIRTIDLGIIPNQRTPFTDINMPTRIFEYVSLGKPVVAPRTRGIQDYFSEDSILFFEPGSAPDLAQRILWAYRHPVDTEAMMERGVGVYRQHSWSAEKKHFQSVIVNLLGQEEGMAGMSGPVPESGDRG